ncbi:MAG: hypothetical protein HC834_06895 [Rhodospirillales bacterium]|nr:hypothetical protein [Rhodospirillales bacterium]
MAAVMVAAMVTLVLMLERSMNLPDNTGTLSDGSLVTLVQLGTGPHHEYFDTRQASTWDRLLYRLAPRKFRHEVGLDVHEVSGKAYPDALSIWLKRHSMTAMPGVIRFRVRDDEGNYATPAAITTDHERRKHAGDLVAQLSPSGDFIDH